MSEKTAGQIAEATKEIVKPVYDDISSVVKPTVGLLSLPVRTVKAVLLPFEKWIVTREQNLENFINQHVPEQLKDVPENMIEAPDAYVGVPILQAASYCDNNELREMYAKLLAKSMFSETKQNMHPSYVKIIEQMCPDEAIILKYMDDSNCHAVICDMHQFTVQNVDERTISNSERMLGNISFLGFEAGCYLPEKIPVYIDNLCRLELTRKVFPKESGVEITLESFPPKMEDITIDEYSFYKNIEESPIKRNYYNACLKTFSPSSMPDGKKKEFYDFSQGPVFNSTVRKKFSRLYTTEFGEAFMNTVISPISIDHNME